ncbi:response regulator [Alicyclobacillus sp. ALC3]|uniref:response regulator n=1 Tax=Alicyclobacillus sp. ALC3 TaxID=2796143 RepID=UPI002379F52B|nr:response regulator [Alicyclobacillus sp. ALC3]WDL98884.1 response regulator [Alicyclobacillus sp. ALC3]
MINVVIVDDQIEIAKILSYLYGLKDDIEILGVAQNAEQLWQLVSDKDVDVVSLDIQLDRENGLELCRLLSEKSPNIFIVMCSVEATEENKKLAKEAGASHFLAKPIEIKDVSETLRLFLDRKNRLSEDRSPLTEEKLDELFGAVRDKPT